MRRARQPGATTSQTRNGQVVLNEPQLIWHRLKDLPRVRGARSFDGVDPELVSNILQPLQGLLVGFVVAAHGFWLVARAAYAREGECLGRFPVSKTRCCATPLLAASTTEEEGHLWLLQQPRPPDAVIGGAAVAQTRSS